MRPSLALTAALLFGSGLSALLYQTAWQRMLRLVFGASTGASAAVLAIFLGGLGLGSLWLGRRAERSARPLLFYAHLEAGIAIAAALTPPLVAAISWIYLGLGGSTALGDAGATLLRLALAALVFGPAVFLMGGTLPAAARSVERESDTARGRLALLYATNTLGAVCGALAGTFALFELLGTRRALWAACALNLAVALVARAAGRREAPLPVSEPMLAAREPGAAGPPAGRDAPPAAFVYAAAGAVGFAFLCLELVWYRMLAPVLGGSSFTFGLVLAVALAGVGAGSLLYARRDPRAPAGGALLTATLALEALCVAFPLLLGDRIALLAAYLRPLATLGFGWLVGSWTAVAALVILPTSLVAGYQFPVLIALLGTGRRRVARHVGLTYACNTLGAIAGALLGGFVLIPAFGAVATWRALAALLIALAAASALLGMVRTRATPRRLALPGALAASALLCLFAEGPTAFWRHSAIGAGRSKVVTLERNDLLHWRHRFESELLWERDGVESSVGLHVAAGIAFILNGKSDGAVVHDRGTQTMLALLPALLHPQPRSVFVLGLGTGMSAGWAAALPGVERVDVAELEPAILRVAKEAAPVNNRVLAHPKVRVLLGDAREFLLTTQRRYDVISSEPSNPYRAGVASLYTREFYAAARERLSAGGLFAQWLQAYEIDAPTLGTVLRTLHSVFSAVEIWRTQGGDLLLIASAAPLRLDVEQLRRRIREEPYSYLLPRVWGVDDAEGVLAFFVADHRLAATLAQALDPPVNTDDATVLEYHFARKVGTAASHVDAALTRHALESGHARPEVTGEVDWSWVAEQRPRAWLVDRTAAPDLPGLDSGAETRAKAVRLVCQGKLERAVREWPRQQRRVPRGTLESYAVGEMYAFARAEYALELASNLEEAGFPAEAALLRARFHAAGDDAARTVDELLLAWASLREHPFPLCDVVSEVLALMRTHAPGRPEWMRRAIAALLEGPLPGYVEETLRVRTTQALTFALGDPELCVRALGRQLEQPWWEQRFLEGRLACLASAGHPLGARAAADVAAFARHAPVDLSEGLATGSPTGSAGTR